MLSAPHAPEALEDAPGCAPVAPARVLHRHNTEPLLLLEDVTAEIGGLHLRVKLIEKTALIRTSHALRVSFEKPRHPRHLPERGGPELSQAADADEGVPQRSLPEQFFGERALRLLHEPAHPLDGGDAPGGAALRHDPAVFGLRPVRLDPDQGKSRALRGIEGRFDTREQRLRAGDEVVRGEDRDTGAAVPGADARQRQEKAGAGAEISGLNDEIDPLVPAQLPPGDRFMRLPHDHDRPLPREPGGETVERHLNERALAVDRRELLREILSIEQAGERSKPGPVTCREHHGPSSLDREVCGGEPPHGRGSPPATSAPGIGDEGDAADLIASPCGRESLATATQRPTMITVAIAVAAKTPKITAESTTRRETNARGARGLILVPSFSSLPFTSRANRARTKKPADKRQSRRNLEPAASPLMPGHRVFGIRQLQENSHQHRSRSAVFLQSDVVTTGPWSRRRGSAPCCPSCVRSRRQPPPAA